MNFVTYAIVLTSLLLGLLASIGANAEEGNSTYNFYFQKAPGPVTVNQGGAAAAPNVLPTPSTTPTVVVPTIVPAPTGSSVVPMEETERRKRFHLSLGYAMNAPLSNPSRYENVSMEKPEYLSGQYAIKGEYDLSERLAITGEVYKLKRQVDFNSGLPFSSDRTVSNRVELAAKDKKVEKNVIDFSIGAAYHLVHLRATTFSLLGGIATAPFIRYDNKANSTKSGFAVPVSVDHETNLYVGSRLRLIADNVWGLDFSYKYLTSAKMGVAQLGLSFAI